MKHGIGTGTGRSRHDWVRKAQDHDTRVGSRLAEKGEEAAVEDGWDPRIQALSDVARAALEKATEALEREELEAAGTPAEVRALCESTVTALRQAELLKGEATARIAMENMPLLTWRLTGSASGSAWRPATKVLAPLGRAPMTRRPSTDISAR